MGWIQYNKFRNKTRTQKDIKHFKLPKAVVLFELSKEEEFISKDQKMKVQIQKRVLSSVMNIFCLWIK